MISTTAMFDLISDMHTEFWLAPYKLGKSNNFYYDWQDEQQSEIIVVAGDCSNSPTTTALILKEARKYYRTVIFTDGNHEHYIGRSHRHMDVDYNCSILQELSEQDGFVYLNGNRGYIHDGVAFLGANGWYDFQAYELATREQQHEWWRKESNDPRFIRFSPNGYPDKLAWRQSVDLAGHVELLATSPGIRKIVMVTHTCPIKRGLFADSHAFGHLNGAYMNSLILDRVNRKAAGKIAVWCYGHTHNQDDFDDHNTGIRFVNNARGYGIEKHKPGYKFDGIKRIEV